MMGAPPGATVAAAPDSPGSSGYQSFSPVVFVLA